MLKQALSRSPYRVCCWRVAIPVQSHESIRNGWWPGDSVWHIMYFSLHTHLSFCFHFMKCFYLWSASDVWFGVFFLVLMTHFQIKAFGRGVTLLGQGPCSTLARTKLQLQQWAAAPGCPCRAAHPDFLAPGWCSFPLHHLLFQPGCCGTASLEPQPSPQPGVQLSTCLLQVVALKKISSRGLSNSCLFYSLCLL